MKRLEREVKLVVRAKKKRKKTIEKEGGNDPKNITATKLEDEQPSHEEIIEQIMKN